MSVRIRLASGVRWSGATVVGVVAALIIVGVVAAGALRVAGSLLTPAADPNAGKAFDHLIAKHDESLLASRQRFDGRSAFFMPPRPASPAPPPPPPPPPPVDPGPPPPPPPPPDYSGPKVIACFGSHVFFGDGTRISVGEEQSGIRVIATNPPWSVKLSHLGREYIVSTVPDSGSSFLTGSLSSFGPSPPGLIAADASPRGAASLPPLPAPRGAAIEPNSGPDAGAVRIAIPDPPMGDGDSTGGRGAPPEPARDTLGAATPPSEPSLPSGPAAGPAGAISAEIPPPLTKAEIDRMDRDQTSKAMIAVSRARMSRSLDEETRARLNQEYSWLQARARALLNR